MIDPQLTENFSLTEWKCHDGTQCPFDLVENVKECAQNLQALRNAIKKPIYIISGYRNPTYNNRIGGAKKSYHMTGKAADIRVRGMSPGEVAAVIERLIDEGMMEQGGIGVYDEDGFTHYDCRGTRARWKG
jgi:uncharacterized protein YcbK (DUF882 family)